jgi:quercetin dioxygenase-like cupin family protein
MMEFASANIFIREMRFEKAGNRVDGHAHHFDHTTYVVRGALRFEKLNEEGSVIRTVDKRASDGRNWVLIEAGVKHRITALEDGSLGHCIYSHRNPQGEVVQEFDGWRPGVS